MISRRTDIHLFIIMLLFDYDSFVKEKCYITENVLQIMSINDRIAFVITIYEVE